MMKPNSAETSTLPEAPPSRGDTPGTDLQSLRSLFCSLAGGEREALDELYRLVGHELYGFALWRCRHRDDAADTVSEVFLRLASTNADLAAVRNPRAYLLMMVRTAAVDRARRSAVPTDEQRAALLIEPEPPNAERVFDARRVSALLGELPTEQREVLYLHHFTDLSFGELGRILGVSRFTVASRHRLGLRKLRRLLGESS